MPLTPDQEQLEHDLRIRQMSTNIEQMNQNIDKMRADMRADARRIAWQTFSALTAAFAAGVGGLALVLNYLSHH